MFTKLKNLDIYPKTLEDFKIKTASGGTISIISIILIVILVFSEFSLYLTPERIDELYVDVGSKKKIEIYINITFPAISCDVVTIDMTDIAGDFQHDIKNTVYKRRLDLDTQKPLDEYKLEKKDQLVKVDENLEKIKAKMKEPTYCGSCYGSEPSPRECCNTCEAVKASYQRKKWTFILNDDVEQCLEESHERKKQYSTKEGCNLHGYFLVNKVQGNFHFSPGRQRGDSESPRINDFLPFEIDHFNTSHIINTLGFGEKYPGIRNPLDDVKKIMLKGSGLFQYYIKVVPTIYEYENQKKIQTNQYSVTQHFRPRNEFHKAVTPGVFFIYDLSPIMVHIQEKKNSFLHFLTNVCAILGGVFTVSSLIDTVLYNVQQPKTLD